MRDEILSEAMKRKLFLSPEAVEILDSNGHSMEMVNTILNALAGSHMFVTEKDIREFLEGDKALFKSEKTIQPRTRRSSDGSKEITGQELNVDSGIIRR